MKLAVSLCICALLLRVAPQLHPVVEREVVARFFDNDVQAKPLKYLLELPRRYAVERELRFPLVVYLHGAGESGANLNWLRRYGPPKYVQQHPDAPFILLAPQAPRANGWTVYLAQVQAILTDVQARYRIDPHRIYLTGNSMGGNGTWHLARQMTDTFTAIAPVASFYDGNVRELCQIKHAAIWVIHGTEDASLPVGDVLATIDVLRACGLLPSLTLLDATDHVATNEIYADASFYDWLLRQRLNP